MRDPDRIPAVLAALARAWQQAPDLRFGQLVEVVRDFDNLHQLGSEDDAWEDAAEAYAVHHGAYPYFHPACDNTHSTMLQCRRCLALRRRGTHDPSCPQACTNTECRLCGRPNDTRADLGRMLVGLGSPWCRDCWDNGRVDARTPLPACTCSPVEREKARRHQAVDELISGLLEEGEEY